MTVTYNLLGVTMPKFTADPTGTIPSNFGFSGADPKTLSGATEYTLAGIVADSSGSVGGFSTDIENSIKAVVSACRRSPRADNLMLRTTVFNHNLTEVHGFKLLQSCTLQDYDGMIKPGGSTALFDATIDMVDAMARYGKDLQANDFDVNGVVFVITDGDNNTGLHRNTLDVKESIARAMKQENLESIVTILIGVNVTDPHMSKKLSTYAAEAGFTQYVELNNATEKTLAKLAEFVVVLISSTSQALGTGGPSQQLPTF